MKESDYGDELVGTLCFVLSGCASGGAEGGASPRQLLGFYTAD